MLVQTQKGLGNAGWCHGLLVLIVGFRVPGGCADDWMARLRSSMICRRIARRLSPSIFPLEVITTSFVSGSLER
jgi:hypothetical protein